MELSRFEWKKKKTQEKVRYLGHPSSIAPLSSSCSVRRNVCVAMCVCVCVNEQEQWEISKLKMLNRHLKMAADGGHSHSHGHGQPHTGHVRSVVWG